MLKLTINTDEYRRSHGRRPTTRNEYGCWWFEARDGERFTATGTYREAVAELQSRAQLGVLPTTSTEWKVLP